MRRLRTAAAAALTGAALLVGAGAASAHVSVSSPDASPGGYGKIVFRVPSESAKASTVKVSVLLPTDTPLAEVSPKVMTGWSVAEQTTSLDKPITNDDGFTVSKAVSKVTWTATGAGIPPEQFDEFELSVGPFPKSVDALHFPTVQTYSNGSVVKWDEVATGGAEPEHPAPALTLTDVADSTFEDSAGLATTDQSDKAARTLGIVAIALAAVGVGLAATSMRRRSADR
jgi:uncharacterized protein YcnI